MSNINNPNPPTNPSEDGWQRVQRIEGYKQKGRPEYPQEEPPKNNLFALFATFFKKVFSLTQKKTKEIAYKKEIAKDLETFQQALHTLAAEDKSHDPTYTQLLSTLWDTVSHDCDLLIDCIGREHPLSKKFFILLEEINQFPPWEDHSLGFYLNKRAGETWLPIPFMEILLALHLSAKNSPLQNPLETWSKMINDIIDTMTES